MATFAIKTVISAIDNVTGPLAKVNKAIKDTFAPIRQLHNATQKLQKELGFPKISQAMRGVSKAYGGVASEVKALGRDIAVGVGIASAAVSSLVWRTSSVGDAAAKTAQKIGISTQAWTELAHAGDMSGVSASTLQSGLTDVNKHLSAAAAGGKKASAMFAYLGIDIYDASGKLKTADAVMAEAADKLNTLENAADRSAIAGEIFGKSAGPEMIPLLAKGSAGIDALRADAVRLGKTFNDVESQQSESFVGAMKRLRDSLDGVIFTVGKQLLPPLTEWAGKITELITANRELIGVKVGEWVQKIQDYLPTLKTHVVAVWESVSNFATKINELVQALGGWETVLPYIAAGIAAIKLAPLALAVVTLSKSIIGLGWALGGTLVKCVYLAVAGLKGLFAFLAANPIAIAVAAVALTAYLIYKHWDEISAWLKDVWASWKWAAGETWDWIKAKVTAVGEAIGGFLSTLWTTITSGITTAWDGIIGYFTGIFGRIKSAFQVDFLDRINGIFAEFKPVETFEKAFNSVFQYLDGLGKRFFDAGAKIINRIWDGLKTTWDSVVNWFKDIGKSITDLVPDSVFKVLDAAKGVGSGVANTVSGVTDTVGGLIGSAGTSLSNWWNGTPSPAPADPTQSEALQFAQQRAARERDAFRASADIRFHNVPPNVDVKSQGWGGMSVARSPLDIARNGVRMGGIQ